MLHVTPVTPTLATTATLSRTPCVLGSTLTRHGDPQRNRDSARLRRPEHGLSDHKPDDRRRSSGRHDHVGALRPVARWLHDYADDNADIGTVNGDGPYPVTYTT